MDMNIIMPQLGESIAEGKITVWLKQEGETIERDESLVEVETDKATVEVPAPASGTLKKILAGIEDVVEVGGPIAVLEVERTEGEVSMEIPRSPARTASTTLPKKEAPKPVPKKPKAETQETKTVRAARETAPPLPVKTKKGGMRLTPIVRRLLRAHDLDPSAINGTGTDGRITREDVLTYIEEHKNEIEQAEPEKPGPARPEAPVEKEEPRADGPDDEVVPLDKIRRRIAERLVRSRHEAAHVTTVAKVDMTEVVTLRKKHKEAYQKKGIKLTYMPFILKATAMALKEFPYVNSSWGDDAILLHKRINLGVAVSLEEKGLVVPVLRDADGLSIKELAQRLQDLAARARSRKLSPEEIQGGTFTITNPGGFGAVLSTPIINQPEAAILAIETIEEVPVVVDGGIVIRSMMNLCLSYDHRIVDGETSIKFLQKIRQVLEAAEFGMG
ncbi:MAG: 2-oxo acid dehydrogenase subunit E2 [Planctomycetes bacterium]|nr:2-oxo acid dehydrogenase subunit E2 [Planctomycetota bacterium]